MPQLHRWWHLFVKARIVASCHDREAVVASIRQGWNIPVLAAEKMARVRCTDAMTGAGAPSLSGAPTYGRM